MRYSSARAFYDLLESIPVAFLVSLWTASFLIATPESAKGVPFDLIVADEIQVPGALWGIGSVGIVVATTDAITREHLEAATIVSSSPRAAFYIFINDPDLPTIMPGQYAGETSRLFSKPPLTALLTGETPAPVGQAQGFSLVIEYDPQLTAGEALSSTFTLILGTEAVTFDVLTTVVDWDQESSFTAQRLRSSPVPELGTGLLLIVGLLGLAGWRRARA
jgi:hypothetical protein